MKEINLRRYYPHYAQDMMVSVSDEVAELLQDFVCPLPILKDRKVIGIMERKGEK